MRLAAIILASVCLIGCRGTQIVRPPVAPWVQTAAVNRAVSSIPSSRRTLRNEQIAVVNRIDQRVNSASY